MRRKERRLRGGREGSLQLSAGSKAAHGGLKGSPEVGQAWDGQGGDRRDGKLCPGVQQLAEQFL